ncbi:murein hydrolase activator EnvC family protein [Pseudothauera rhizosphaerae]|uniref:Peptidase M23 n=1 Tax=Pseudothauera rhizosphaerae TaxID=2565932 RepID=A0A4S4AM75_9RHOO|nr:peptidoglycan DD-metalloendopeptidase family protein [Pseudothauera rhizosphaerae]THF60700.1 peptidase M23 [Pseudothauera rhizosphaerae]
MPTSGHMLRAACAALLLGLLPAGGVLADPTAEAEQRRADLDEVKQRIRELQKEIAATEQSHSGATAALVEAERSVSRLQRRLRQLAGERVEAERALARLERERTEVEARIAARQTELADWLRRHYMYGGADGVAPFLSARDPNQIARDAHYLEHLGRARLALIDELRGDLREKAELAAAESARRDRLAALETEQQERRTELQAMQETRKRAVAELAAQLQGQRKEVATLRQDEQRLGRLVEALARAARAQERAREQAAARAAAQQRSSSGAVATPGRSAEPVVGRVNQAAGPSAGNVAFDKLRGKLRFPVRGELVGRFGAPRAEGGTTWRGVFIRAAGGADVRAVAAGEVVYSDWLRGFGNLIIIDHGRGYLTVYGNNDALLKVVGDPVAGGDPIASVGTSGGGAETGLYFEIRHEGRPVDPLQWVRLD